MGLNRGGTLLRMGWLPSPLHMLTKQPPSPRSTTRCRDPFPIPAPRDPRRAERRCSPPPLALPVLLPSPPLITISSCPWAKPQRLLHAWPRLASPPALRKREAHAREPGAPAALPGQRKAEMLLTIPSYPGVGVQVLRGSRLCRPPAAPNPIPCLSGGAAGRCGAGYGENWSVSAGEGGAQGSLPPQGAVRVRSRSNAPCPCRQRGQRRQRRQAPSHMAASPARHKLGLR